MARFELENGKIRVTLFPGFLVFGKNKNQTNIGGMPDQKAFCSN